MMNQFKNKRVLVTGHTGFKGSWLSAILKYFFSAEVYGFSDKIPSQPSHFELFRDDFKIDCRGDISNRDEIKDLIFEIRPRYIFHLAAQSLVNQSFEDPYSTFMANTCGTLNLLDAINNFQEPITVVIVTSDKAYDNLEISRGYRENDALGGKDPYSASKGAAELIIKGYSNSFFSSKDNIKLGIARAGNVIGGGDWSLDRILPDAIRCWREAKILEVRQPNSTRPWQHVMEPLNGYISLARNLDSGNIATGEAFNFGPKTDQSIQVNEFVEILKYQLEGLTSKSVFTDVLQKESKLLFLDSSKAKKLLRWQTVLSTNEAIELSTDWYKNFYSVATPTKELTLKQIDWYFNKLK